MIYMLHKCSALDSQILGVNLYVKKNLPNRSGPLCGLPQLQLPPMEWPPFGGQGDWWDSWEQLAGRNAQNEPGTTRPGLVICQCTQGLGVCFFGPKNLNLYIYIYIYACFKFKRKRKQLAVQTCRRNSACFISPFFRCHRPISIWFTHR